MVGIHDIDIEILGDYGLTYDTYFPEVSSLAAFICSAIEDGLDIIIDNIGDTVSIEKVIKPIYNFKASEHGSKGK